MRVLAIASFSFRAAFAALGVLAGSALVAAAAEPVARWDFHNEEVTRVELKGDVQRDVPGPRPPQFPGFASNNTAVAFGGNGARLVIADSGPNSAFDFTNGDAFTVEAWVKLDELRPGEMVAVIGKGRTGSPDFARDNQNWALRVREVDGKACLNFLFATKPDSGVKRSDAHWHRWTSQNGYPPTSGWHHLAISYRFGEPSSLRGWIDGIPTAGAWDMGGTTAEPPVVDDDAVWIGSTNGGGAGNSLRGSIDAIALYREIATDAAVKSRSRRIGEAVQSRPAPEVMPELGPIPRGQVRVTFAESMPAPDRWLYTDESWPDETARFVGTRFLLTRLPLRYDAWGIRDSWRAPVLVRLAADVSIAPGRQRFLIRARGLSRLWVNGEVVARTEANTKSPPDGEEPVIPVATPSKAGMRAAGYQQSEAVGEAEIPSDGRCRVVFETVVGSKIFRPQTGELCVAVGSPDGESFTLLSAAGIAPDALTDEHVVPLIAELEEALARHDDETRRQRAASRDAFWARRHEQARQWVRENPAPAVPAGAPHPIDAFLGARIQQAVAASEAFPAADASRFRENVLPLLRDGCFRCHGEKEKGGLRLNSREALLAPGDSGEPAVVPGDPEASLLLARVRGDEAGERMPPGDTPLTEEQIRVLEGWIQAGAQWPEPPVSPEQVRIPPVVADAAFLRRVSLDTIGIPPSAEELRAFLADPSPEKRSRAIDRLLADERAADHEMATWLDLLAENPSLINVTLNSTGPFRWFLYDSFRDGKAFDRLVTELILLRGSEGEGGSAGFGLAGENDAPMAAKGHVVGAAFLGIELQCARCHDSPFHSTLQRDLYALAAMFARKPVSVPPSSTVPAAFFEKRERPSIIKVTLKPGEPVAPVWPFAGATGSVDDASLSALLEHPDDPRERLAALVTSPRNARFARVVVNHVWRRLLGAGFVEPAHDWEGQSASHPELLAWLATEFVSHDYDLKHIQRLILTSETYQREADGRNLAAAPEVRFFNAPDPRRLSAEEVVDSLHAAMGRAMDVEELTFNPNGLRPSGKLISLGVPRRAWMFASLANERDRPSLSLPKAAMVATMLEAFGWTGARQMPRCDRESEPNVLQPGVMANSLLATQLTRASANSTLAEIALSAESPETLVDTLFARILSRPPTEAERRVLAEALREGFTGRVVPPGEVISPPAVAPLPRVTWFNHLQSEANTIAKEQERRARLGPPADPRLRPSWREAFEDVVWSLINTREFVWKP